MIKRRVNILVNHLILKMHSSASYHRLPRRAIITHNETPIIS